MYGSTGLASVVFTGGTVDQLATAAAASDAAGVWTQDPTGAYQLLVAGGPAFLRDSFKVQYPAGLGLIAVTLVRSAQAVPAPAPVPGPAPLAVAVTRVIDGDTLEVRAAETTLRVRLYGIDAPEVGDRCAAEATRRLATLAGTAVWLVPDARLTDPFGRELRDVYAEDDTSIDATLVSEGLAHAWKQDGAHRDALVAIEVEARAARRGCLWSVPPSARPSN